MNKELIKTFVSQSVILPYRIVAFGSMDGYVVQAKYPTDSLIGVSDSLQSEVEHRCDIILSGIAEILFEAAVPIGGFVTTSVEGKGILASAGNRRIGISMGNYQPGDIGDVFLCIG